MPITPTTPKLDVRENGPAAYLMGGPNASRWFRTASFPRCGKKPRTSQRATCGNGQALQLAQSTGIRLVLHTVAVEFPWRAMDNTGAKGPVGCLPRAGTMELERSSEAGTAIEAVAAVARHKSLNVAQKYARSMASTLIGGRATCAAMDGLRPCARPRRYTLWLDPGAFTPNGRKKWTGAILRCAPAASSREHRRSCHLHGACQGGSHHMQSYSAPNRHPQLHKPLLTHFDVARQSVDRRGPLWVISTHAAGDTSTTKVIL
jgi:hypothetical protein